MSGTILKGTITVIWAQPFLHRTNGFMEAVWQSSELHGCGAEA
jgi:hypothetical protein